jgi:hypothetical protein
MSEILGGGISLSDFDEQFKNLIIPHGLALSNKHISNSCYDEYDTGETIQDSLYDKLLKMASYEPPEEEIELENAKKREIEKKKEIEKAKEREVTLQPVIPLLNKKKTKSKGKKMKQKQTRRKRT